MMIVKPALRGSEAFLKRISLLPQASWTSMRLVRPCTIEANYTRNLHLGRYDNGFFGPPSDESVFKKVARKVGWTDISRSILLASGQLMYTKIADEIDYLKFFKYCNLEDTFYSWYTVVELHIWLISARLMLEGKEGKIVRNSMIKAMWDDCDLKSKQLEGALASARKRQITELSEHFQTALINYDEGLNSDDMVLAGALWRRFLRSTESEVPSQDDILKRTAALELLVIYVRSEFYRLHTVSKEQLILKRVFQFSPFDENLLTLAESKR